METKTWGKKEQALLTNKSSCFHINICNKSVHLFKLKNNSLITLII